MLDVGTDTRPLDVEAVKSMAAYAACFTNLSGYAPMGKGQMRVADALTEQSKNSNGHAAHRINAKSKRPRTVRPALVRVGPFWALAVSSIGACVLRASLHTALGPSHVCLTCRQSALIRQQGDSVGEGQYARCVGSRSLPCSRSHPEGSCI